MCGILGFAISNVGSRKAVANRFRLVAKAIAQRGPDCFGYTIWAQNEETLAFDVVKEYRVKNLTPQGIVDALADFEVPAGYVKYVCLANFRGIPTSEDYKTSSFEDVQPFEGLHVSVVHNGLFSNDKELYARNNWVKLAPHLPVDIDSYALCHIFSSKYQPHRRLDLLAQVQGSYAFAAFNPITGDLWMGRNFRGLSAVHIQGEDHTEMWFASESQALQGLVSCPPWEMPLNSLLHHNARNAPPTFDVLRDQCQQIQPRQHSLETSCVVVLSGGLDSTVCATMAALSYSRVHLMHFQYGCRAEAREAEAFLGIAEYLRARFPQTQITHSIEDLGFIKRLGGSTLTDHTLEVAQGEKGVETDNEWVPARNLVMISLAAAYCDRHGFGKIMLGLNMEEGSVFADNSIEFYQRLEAALAIGVKNAPQLTMPLGNDMKRHIVKRGIKLDAPFHLSWSCYHGGALRCSRCGPCIMRIKAFVANGLRDDPSLYVEGAEV